MTALNLTPASERGVEYIMDAVQCYAEEWKTMTMSSRNRDANHERRKATLARIRTMLEDDARKLEAALAQSPVSAPPNPFAWIIVRNSDDEWDGGSPMMDKTDADYYLATECLPGFHLEPIYRAAPVSAEGLERDAARYRHMRESWYRNNGQWKLEWYLPHSMRGGGQTWPDRLDASIDAAIAATDKGAAS